MCQCSKQRVYTLLASCSLTGNGRIQKLIAQEYAAMFLEQTVNKGFQLVGRSLLVDKYQFMSLKEAKEVKGSKVNQEDKLRRDYFRLDCGVARME